MTAIRNRIIVSQRSTPPFAQGLIAEIVENVRRHSLNMTRLKGLLYYMGDETYETYPDWGWRWSGDAELIKVARRRYEDPRWRRSVSPQLARTVDDFYAILADQPPAMEEWALEWDGGDNTFYTFILGKLDGCGADVRSRGSYLVSVLQGGEEIHGAQPSMRRSGPVVS